jgi:hypothetical protein
MGPEIKIIALAVENDGTLLQVDTGQGRMFIPMRDIYKELNNYAQRNHEARLIEMGFEKDGENTNLLN